MLVLFSEEAKTRLVFHHPAHCTVHFPWVLRDSQRSLLNRFWRVLTTSPDIQRVLNHRLCDKWHKHGRLYDHFNTSSSQIPKSLCQALAKQFFAKDSWHSALGIPGHLRPDDDERPLDLSACCWETLIGLESIPSEMEVGRAVEMAPPVPLVVDASPTSSERKEITNWLRQIHRQIGHRDNRTLVRLLKQRGTHMGFEDCARISLQCLRRIQTACPPPCIFERTRSQCNSGD